MRDALVAWMASTRYLLWAAVEALTRAVTLNKEAQRRMAILKPRTPQELFDEGYALFAYNIGSDMYDGVWRDQVGTLPEIFMAPNFRGVAWHPVEINGMPLRAVSLEVARENYRPGFPLKAAA